MYITSSITSDSVAPTVWLDVVAREVLLGFLGTRTEH
jgi:hypothetical protein